MSRILIIDDERAIRRTLREILEFEEFEVYEAANGKEGLEKALAKAYDIIFCDIKMPILDGMEVLDELVKAKCESPVIMISGHGNIDTAVQAIKKGAFDFIEKPLDLNRILVTIRNAKDKTRFVEETKVLKTTVKRLKGSSIIGETEEIQKIKEMIQLRLNKFDFRAASSATTMWLMQVWGFIRMWYQQVIHLRNNLLPP